MAEFIYQMHDVRKTVGEKVILDGVTLSFYPDAKIGVVGPNGAGKSTLLKVMAGLEPINNGEAYLAKDATVGLLQQEPPLTEDKTVLENVEEAVADLKGMLNRFNEISAEMANPDADYDALLPEMGELQEQLDARNAWDIDSQLQQAMDALQCPPPDTPVNVMSGGERRRVALCKLLLEQPDLLLLDEPTNHLDAESVNWLEAHLKAYPGAVLCVTHDRYFLDNVVTWICEVDRGRLFPYEGNYSTYLETKRKRLQIEGQKDAKRAKILEKELEWVRSSPKARQAKNKARLARYEELAAEAERSRKLDTGEINIPPGKRLGAEVLDANKLHKGFDGRILFNGLSFDLPRAGIVGVIGPNGVGKSTLFKMIVGEETPDSGELKVGKTVEISYVDQNRSGIDPEKNVWEVVSDGLDYIKVGNFEVPSRAYVAAFGFKGPDQQKPSGVLSGGERNRLNLALTLKQGGNMLLLDEPTNDLDVETLQSLEDALLEFPGCAVVISHDRWFLDRVATHILAWEGEGEDGNDPQWFWFEGNFADYETNKVARLGEEASRPHASRYRRLTRD
ncbi:energy-dependent translational throttle protein EttA [Propionibacterium freudenreichii]|uniref:Energy-dependent translational throttle protein EttA n=1 Tax=Propionibacterium freudenreichii subsp. freudenreichii TaxID=66712 RepID=A0A0B7NW98_PROFF|nr:energy-dependent translational throttle protein EttA [Propionibacterium freudenreichii]AJQ90487.1 ATP-binding cassette protein, ChvD family [Propionibacterium freudenreichii subsp. freudenreichii]MCT2973109.1 energy-dependent translational throttle protein EttA [Propionibacterium freudenreichii]MDK9341409.1 energy-dependent translational throttle protein EttA [Propionibacterium freudenreichii]CEG91606.1 ABC2 protein of ABC transporter (ART:REG) [Propionibacterium freudenreichii]CEP27086.1 A